MEEHTFTPPMESFFGSTPGKVYRRTRIGGLLEEQRLIISEGERGALLSGRTGTELFPLSDGNVFQLGERELTVIHTPGHTMGSICLRDSRHGFLYSGDTICGMGVMLSFPCSASVSVFLDSVRKLKRQKGIAEVYGGHHRVPLGTEYFDKYLTCGEHLLQGTEGAFPEKSVFGSFYRFPFEDISLTYTEDKRK